MISLPNLLKKEDVAELVQQYQFPNEYSFAQLQKMEQNQGEKQQTAQQERSFEDSPLMEFKDFSLEDTSLSKENKEHTQEETKAAKPEKKKSKTDKEKLEEQWQKKWKEEDEQHQQKLQKLMEDAKKEAEKIVAEAKKKAKKIEQEAQKKGHEEGYAKGYEQGDKEGRETAYHEIQQTEGMESRRFLEELKQVAQQTSAEKQRLITQYKDELKELTIAVAEKVIQVSLRSSGEIIEKMILSATERLKSKEWVKIYISKTDAELMLEADKDIIHALSHLSEHIRVVAMEGEKQGTCILEFPDEIIDASVNTQMENIKEILHYTAT